MQKTNKSTLQKIPILDLPFAAYNLMNGNEPELQIQGTRVIFIFDADNTFNTLSTRYNSNETVPVLDFVNATRQLRAKMFSMRGQK